MILPFLVLTLLIAIDFGRLFFSYVQVTNGAREGAAYGITHPEDSAGIESRARQETNAQAQAGEGTVTVTAVCSPSSCATAYTSTALNQVTVTVSEQFKFFTPVIGDLFSNFSLNASATSVALGGIGIPAPTAAPTPTLGPTPTPAPCTVPNFVGTKKNPAAGTWSGAGFSGAMTYNPNPNGNWTILSQSIPPGAAPCTSAITIGG